MRSAFPLYTTFRFLSFAVAASLALAAQSPPAQKPVDFQREIRPVLSENCFQCHGPDATARMAGLRLDLKDAAMQSGKNGAAIVPGKPDASLLYQRISSGDEGRRMPPAHSHRKLTPQQIALLKDWIATGASWQEHWAFKAPVRA